MMNIVEGEWDLYHFVMGLITLLFVIISIVVVSWSLYSFIYGWGVTIP